MIFFGCKITANNNKQEYLPIDCFDNGYLQVLIIIIDNNIENNNSRLLCVWFICCTLQRFF